MHNTPASSAAAGAVPESCALESELLNSERISERFGNCGIDVLEHGPAERRSSLFSIDNDRRVCRSYAVVQFVDPESAEIREAHRKILAGDSIGATFKAAGWQIRKVTRHIGTATLVGDHAVARRMQLAGDASLAVHAYRLILEKGERRLHYATIIEVHHPDYLAEAELQGLYDWDDAKRLPADVIDRLVNRVFA